MGRYLGPKHRLCRRAGEKLCTLDRCPSTRRPFPPGIHGQRVRRKLTEYGTQLLEKQKARATYGLLERQLRGYYERALRQRGDTSVFFAQLLELRLDNVVYRLGLSKSRAGARQIVGHGHVLVNGKRLDIPSYEVRVGDVVQIRPASQRAALFAQLDETVGPAVMPQWLSMDRKAFEGRVLRLPTAEDVQHPFRLQSIVEFYRR